MNKIMKTNEHPLERTARVALGIGLLAFFFANPGAWWAVIGVVPLVTGMTGNCPVYGLFGISTCSTPDRGSRRTSRS